MKKRTILAFMMDRPGVLNKISMLMRRKMYNVDTLTVCRTNKPGISRMTITLQADDNEKVAQVIKQIEKVTEVISAKELDKNESFWREVAIIKLEITPDELETFRNQYHFEIIDHQNSETFIIQIAGTSEYIDTFFQGIGEERIIEMARTGVTAMEN